MRSESEKITGIEAEILLDKQKREINTLEDFEKLRPRPFSFIYKFILILLVVGFFEYFFGSTVVSLTIVVALLYPAIAYENERINKRIDLLMKYVSEKVNNA